MAQSKVSQRSAKRSDTPTGPYLQYVKAIKAAGATEFCGACYSHVLPGHVECPDWRALGLPVFSAPAAVLVLDGGLVAEDIDTAEPVTAEAA